MMRRLFAATVMAIWPGVALAQTSTLAPVPPLPPIGLPLPEISGSLTPPGLSGGTERPPSQKVQRPPRHRGGKHRGHRSPAVIFVPVYPWSGGYDRHHHHDKYKNTRRSADVEYEEPAAQPVASPPVEPPKPAPAPAPAPEDVPPPKPPEPPPPPSTFYYIPGCYMGNVPPTEVDLPPGCDPDRVIVRKPS
jgi:hypothetical protein